MVTDKFPFVFRSILVSFLCCLFLLIDGCSALRDLAESIQKPQLSITDVHVTGFNFSEIELTYDVKVNNPNALSVQVLSYDYELDINDRTFISGKQSETTQIESSGESTFQVPVTLNFQKVYSAVESLVNKDEVSYEFKSTFAFDVPALGRTQVPVSTEGTIPLAHIPEIGINNLEVNNISPSSATLSLNMEFDNPNGFGLNVDDFNYSLEINGDQWAEGSALESTFIAPDATTQLTIPVTLNVAEMGISVYRMITGSQKAEYKFTGNFTFGTTHPLLGQTSFSINREGQIPLTGGN